MKMMKLFSASALAFAAVFATNAAMAADGGCADFKTELAGTTATLLAPTPVASIEPTVDMLMPSETATAFYTGDNVPIVKKLDGTPGTLAWKPEEVLLGNVVDAGPKTFVLAQANLDMLNYDVIKAAGSVVNGDEALGEKLTF